MTYDADPGVVFLTVSMAQLINDSVPSCHSNRAIANEAAVPADELRSTQNQLPQNSSPEAKDVNLEEENNRLYNNRSHML